MGKIFNLTVGHRFLDLPECMREKDEAPITFRTNALNFEVLLINQQKNFMFFLGETKNYSTSFPKTSIDASTDAKVLPWLDRGRKPRPPEASLKPRFD